MEIQNIDADDIFKKSILDTGTEKHRDKTQYCELCKVHFHEKYRKNHIFSKFHRSKSKENNIPDSDLYCSQCDEVFSDVAFHDAHKGTKTHKRNLKAHADQSTDKSSENDVFTGGAFSPMAVKITEQDLDDHAEKAFTRKKYKTRHIYEQGTYRQQYISMLTAYLSLRLALDENIKDFCISTNDRKWQSFGDIVISVTKDKSAVYAIRCRPVSDSEKQIDSLAQAKIDMDQEFKKLAVLKKIKEFSTVRFLIFTTNNTSSKFNGVESENTVEVSGKTLNMWKTENGIVPESDIILVKSSKRRDFLDVTSDRDNVFSIYPKNENESYQLPFVYFFTNQKISRTTIYELLRKKFEEPVHHRYLEYIEKWGEGKLGGNYYLTKTDVVLKIGEILLSSYSLFPKNILFGNGNFDIWNEVMSQADLTVLKKENFIASKICQPINQKIETMLAKIDEVSKIINISEEILEAVKEPIIRAYLFEEYDSQENDIPLSKIYIIFWKAGKIPLLLETEKKEEIKIILSVIRFMKEYGVHRKFILKSSQQIGDNSFKIFSCVDDMKHLFDLNKVKISYHGGNLSLRDISASDPLFLKWITPNIFFDMALGKYEIKKSDTTDEEKPDDLNMILDDKTKKKLILELGYEYPVSQNDSGIGGRLKGVDPVWF